MSFIRECPKCGTKVKGCIAIGIVTEGLTQRQIKLVNQGLGEYYLCSQYFSKGCNTLFLYLDGQYFTLNEKLEWVLYYDMKVEVVRFT